MQNRTSQRWARVWVLVIPLLGCRAYGPTVLSEAVTPASLSFASASLDALQQTVQVTNIGAQVLEIRSVAMAVSNDITLPPAWVLTSDCSGAPRFGNVNWLASGECAQIVVQYAPQPDETVSNAVVIVSDAPGSEVIQVPVTAINTIVECPAPDQFVAQIEAATATGPLPAGGTLLPRNITFVASWTAADPSVTVSDDSWTVLTAPPMSNPMTPNGSNATLDASVSGVYEIGLTLVDSQGCATQQATFPFTVSIPPCQGIVPPMPPMLFASVGPVPLTPSGVRVGTTVSFDAIDAVPGTNPITNYDWSFLSTPSGNTSRIVPDFNQASIQFEEAGTYVVAVTVGDTVGCLSSQATITVVVAPLPTQQCGPGSQFIYTVDINAVMYKFDPATATYTTLGPIGCSSGSTPNTMAVDRLGTAWVEYADGSLFQVDTNNLDCFPTSLEESGNIGVGWGSCFAAGGAGGTSDTYFIAENSTLAIINTTTLQVTTVGEFLDQNGALIGSEGELTGTPTGQLFGLFPGNPWTVDGIDKTTGGVVSVKDEPVIAQGTDGAENWAFASWGSDFWFFVGNGQPTSVYHDSADAGTTTFVLDMPAEIVGAGVSPCAQPTEGD